MKKEEFLIEFYNRKIYETIECLSRKNNKYYNYLLLGNINNFKARIWYLEGLKCGL